MRTSPIPEIEPGAELRFWARVDSRSHPNGCWPWTGYTEPNGYGRVWAGSKPVLAHRLAYVLATGRQIPEGLVIDHVCYGGQLGCCRPDHMRVVTQSENARAARSGASHDNRLKQSCPVGHPYTTRWHRGKPYRVCVTCKARYDRLRRQRPANAPAPVVVMKPPPRPRPIRTVCKDGHDMTLPEAVIEYQQADGRVRRHCRRCSEIRYGWQQSA